MAIDKTVIDTDYSVDEVLVNRARRAVASREEMSPDERYEVMLMLGLVPGQEDPIDMKKNDSMTGWNMTLKGSRL